MPEPVRIERSRDHQSHALPARRLVAFADPRQAAPAVLLPALLEAVDRRTDIAFAGLLLSHPPYGWLRRRANYADRCLQRWLGTGRLDSAARTLAGDVLAAFRRRQVPVAVLPSGNPNDASVLALLRDRFKAQFALSLYCMRRFESQLLDEFDQCVNYHNGFLPQYRGLRASNWSIYDAQARSGFVFHHMETALDAGAILLQGQVPVGDENTPGDLEVRKARAAAECLPMLLDAMVRGDPGHAQAGTPSYRSAQDWRNICTVPDPASLTAAEWFRRCKAFVRIRTRLDRGWVAITGLAAEPRQRGLGFRSADQQWLRITSIDFLPTWMHRLRDG